MDSEQDVLGIGAVASASIRPRVGPEGLVQWHLRKNCSLAPARLGACLVGFSLPGLMAGIGFFVGGAPVILALLVVQFATIAWCFVQYATHAADREELTISTAVIAVHIVCGAHEVHMRFDRARVVLTLLSEQHDLIALSEPGLSVRVGSCLPRHVRPQFFRDLCAAARSAQVSDTGASPCLRRALSQASLPSSNSRQGEGRHS